MGGEQPASQCGMKSWTPGASWRRWGIEGVGWGAAAAATGAGCSPARPREQGFDLTRGHLDDAAPPAPPPGRSRCH